MITLLGMCGRAALFASADELREVFGLSEPVAPLARYNVPPSQALFVVRLVRTPEGPGRTLEPLGWGLVPGWAKTPAMGRRLALARVESIFTTPAFREAIRTRRCLVPVSGFYEWKRSGAAGNAVPHFFHREDQRVFALAGIWSRWSSPGGQTIETCAILTQAALPPADAIHTRMPMVMEGGNWDAWLDPGVNAIEELEPLLARRGPSLASHPVGPWVNDPRLDGPKCIVREEPAQQTLFGG